MNASLVMMALGVFRFGVSGGAHQKLQQAAKYRWAKVDRIGREPALQFLGPDTQELTLEGVIYPHYSGGLRQVDLMRAQAGLGMPMMLVDGMGFVWKRWSIVAVNERKSFFMADGAPRKIEFTIQLKAYGPDAGLLSDLIGGLF